MSRTAKLTINGFDELLAQVQKAGNSIEHATERALLESAEPIYDDIVKWVDKHKRTGATKRGIIKPKVTWEGNTASVEVGIKSDGSTAWHAVFVEYGTPKNSPDPGIRNAFKNNAGKVRAIQKRILIEEGLPSE